MLAEAADASAFSVRSDRRVEDGSETRAEDGSETRAEDGSGEHLRFSAAECWDIFLNFDGGPVF